MKFPFFFFFLVFCLWLGYEIHKSRNKAEQDSYDFWEKEAQANNTRKKSLDNLDYIKIPFDSLPTTACGEDPVIMEYWETLKVLSENPIVNFTGISNTDLKLMYGAPNIDLLSRYDQNYTILVRTLQKLAQTLYDKKYLTEACHILEFAVSVRTDITGSYKLLASIYQQKGQPEKILDLIPIAEGLNTSLSKRIVSMLEELVP